MTLGIFLRCSFFGRQSCTCPGRQGALCKKKLICFCFYSLSASLLIHCIYWLEKNEDRVSNFVYMTFSLLVLEFSTLFCYFQLLGFIGNHRARELTCNSLLSVFHFLLFVISHESLSVEVSVPKARNIGHVPFMAPFLSLHFFAHQSEASDRRNSIMAREKGLCSPT